MLKGRTIVKDKCNVCLREKCNEPHYNLSRYIFFNEDGQCELSEKGKKHFGKDYLRKLQINDAKN